SNHVANGELVPWASTSSQKGLSALAAMWFGTMSTTSRMSTARRAAASAARSSSLPSSGLSAVGSPTSSPRLLPARARRVGETYRCETPRRARYGTSARAAVSGKLRCSWRRYVAVGITSALAVPEQDERVRDQAHGRRLHGAGPRPRGVDLAPPAPGALEA